ncbi:MAG: HAMP domain-containing sensor histidine kinase [Solirubrobacteraceae bacterium]
MTEPTLSSNQELVAALHRVAQGDFSMPVQGEDELSVCFNEMLVKLRHHDHDLREAGTRMAAASDVRRRQAERDLHDGVQQHLALLALKLSILRTTISRDCAAAEGMCEELNRSLQGALRELRTLAHGLYPAVLENAGLVPALRDAAERIEIPTRFDVPDGGRCAPHVEATVYFCCLEALQNAAKHAGGDARASVTITEQDGALSFEVSDDGIGFERSSLELGTGLQHITDRVAALSGTLRISSAPGQGTRVRGTVPLR